MQDVDIAIIGGSGLSSMDGIDDVEEHRIMTSFGFPSSSIKIGTIGGTRVAFLARHGADHHLLPSELPHKANIYALKSLGIKHILAISACGSLKEEISPGHLVVPDQIFDMMKQEGRTFFGNGLVAHVNVAHPFCNELRQVLIDSVRKAGGTVHDGGCYMQIEGPRFSTRGESMVFRQWGMSIIGMTTAPEAFLAREAGMCYSVLALVTDYDTWRDEGESVNVEMVLKTMADNKRLAEDTMKHAIPLLVKVGCKSDCRNIMKGAVMSKGIPEDVRQELGPIIEGIE